MTYYPDPTPYAYSQSPDEDMINVGWLGRGHDLMRGYHECELCPEADDPPIQLAAPVEGGRVYLGMSEIRLRALDGRLYSAPTLVIHYIQAHQYLPPDEFLEALRRSAQVEG